MQLSNVGSFLAWRNDRQEFSLIYCYNNLKFPYDKMGVDCLEFLAYDDGETEQPQALILIVTINGMKMLGNGFLLMQEHF